MSRPKGSKNVNVSSFNKELLQDEIRKASVSKVEAKQEEPIYAVYCFLEESDPGVLISKVNNFCMNLGWQCQGGVSVTCYRDVNGIEFVYAQAMIRKE